MKVFLYDRESFDNLDKKTWICQTSVGRYIGEICNTYPNNSLTKGFIRYWGDEKGGIHLDIGSLEGDLLKYVYEIFNGYEIIKGGGQ